MELAQELYDAALVDFMEYLDVIDDGPNILPLQAAMNRHPWNLDEIELILQRDPNAIKEMEIADMPPLYLAVVREFCSVAVVKLLLFYGADPNLRYSSLEAEAGSGLPLLSLALICRDSVGIIRALVEGGARADEPGDCSLQLALAKNAEIEVIKLLVSAGADLFKRDFSGKSPIIYAVKHYDVQAFKSLLDLQDVDINLAKNKANGSLLHCALIDAECPALFVKILIDRGIEVNSVEPLGNTPLHIAAAKKVAPDIVEMLLKSGSLVNVQNKSGATPLDFAMVRYCNPDVVQLLLKYSLLEDVDFSAEVKFRRHELAGMFSDYINECKLELQRMYTENIDNGLTLFEFLQMYSGKQIYKTREEGFDVNRLLQIIADDLYPLYSNVISSKLGRSLLLDKLRQCNIFTVSKNKSDVNSVARKVVLKCDCVLILAKYLDEKALLNTIMAFCY